MTLAAYFLVIPRLYTTPTASLGSIGVYISFYDWCDYLKNAGIKLELFKAGEKKGVGIMGNPLADGDREDLQGRVEETYRIFTSDVTRNRSIAKPIMQGQSLQGRAAMDANLCDAFHPSASAFLTALAKGRLRS